MYRVKNKYLRWMLNDLYYNYSGPIANLNLFKEIIWDADRRLE